MLDQYLLQNGGGFGAQPLLVAGLRVEGGLDGVGLLVAVGHLADRLDHQACTVAAEGY